MNLPETLVDTGYWLLNNGHSLLPVNNQKRPHAQALIQTGYGVPGENGLKATWKPLQELPPTKEQLQEWLQFPDVGLALVTGQVSQTIVIDADGEAGIAQFEAWNISPHVKSRSGGFHWYVQAPAWRVPTLQSQTNMRLAEIRGIDIRADGGYVLIPPTIIQGKRYQWLRSPLEKDEADVLPLEVCQMLGLKSPPVEKEATSINFAPLSSVPAFAPLPRNLHSAARQELQNRLIDTALNHAYSGQGREVSGFNLACQLRDNQFTPEEAHEIMCYYVSQVPATNTKSQHEPYRLDEAINSLRQAYNAPAREPWKVRHPKDIYDEVRLIWPERTHAEREQLARCLLGSKNPQSAALLTELGYDTTHTEKYLNDLKAQGRIIPGLNSLRKLLGSSF